MDWLESHARYHAAKKNPEVQNFLLQLLWCTCLTSRHAKRFLLFQWRNIRNHCWECAVTSSADAVEAALVVSTHFNLFTRLLGDNPISWRPPLPPDSLSPCRTSSLAASLSALMRHCDRGRMKKYLAQLKSSHRVLTGEIQESSVVCIRCCLTNDSFFSTYLILFKKL